MISPSDLLAPKGDISVSLFPNEDGDAIETRLTGYIEEATAVAAAAGIAAGNLDDAIKAYAYYRAYHAVYVLLLADPAKQSFDQQGSTESVWEQIKGFDNLSNEHLAAYRTLIPVTTGTTPEILPPTTSLPTSFTF